MRKTVKKLTQKRMIIISVLIGIIVSLGIGIPAFLDMKTILQRITGSIFIILIGIFSGMLSHFIMGFADYCKKESKKYEENAKKIVQSNFSKECFKEIKFKKQKDFYYSLINPIIELEGYKYYAKMSENDSIILRIIRCNNGNDVLVYEEPIQMNYVQFQELFDYE